MELHPERTFPRENDQVEMRLASTALSVESGTKDATRAAFEGAISSGNTLTARVLASSTSGDYTPTLYADGTMTFSNDGTSQAGFTTPKYYPSNNDEIYFCGLYPATGWAATQTTTSTFSFNGTQDVMAAAQVSSNKTKARAGTFETLRFKHLLTQLVINVVADNDAAIAAWGNLQILTLSKAGGSDPYTKAEVTLSDGTAGSSTAFSTTSGSFNFWTSSDEAFTGQSVALTTTATKVAYSMVCPIIATGTNDYILLVTTANSGTAVSVPVNLKQKSDGTAYTGDTQGKKFEVTLTFKASEIMARGSVTDWVSDGQSGEVIQ